MISGMQVRYKINDREWTEWEWLGANLSWTYSTPHIHSIALEFRWRTISDSKPVFVREEGLYEP